jgi:UDP-3-O-[3-hydroxymyristoyl] N-acetylglucosamine deacetylase/3-hydroxyacyl-[acyl-carrier-protein] dehydratase
VYEDRRSDSRITIEPWDSTVFDVTIDFNSRVVGVQRACFDTADDYAREIAPCRTFCFLHEIELLQKFGLIKGGSLDNALVIDEPKGYLAGQVPFFDNELARHKLLDLMGDFSLLGRPFRGKVTAWKPGHKVNTQAIKKFLETL